MTKKKENIKIEEIAQEAIQQYPEVMQKLADIPEPQQLIKDHIIFESHKAVPFEIPEADPTRVLDYEKNKVELLTLKELKLTVDELSMRSEPLNGMRHYDLWEKVLELAYKNNLSTEVQPIMTTDGGSKNLPGVSILPMIEESRGKKNIQAHLLRRAWGLINLTDDQNDISHGGIAICFHQGGIQVAYGQIVKACINLAIFGDHRIETYGPSKVGINKMFEVLENFMRSHGDTRRQQVQIMTEMENYPVDTRIAIPELIGNLEIEAVKQAYLDTHVIAPFNIGQVSTFTKALLKEAQERALPDYMNLWNLYNAGTNILKVGEMDMINVINQNQAFGNFIVDKYKLN